MAALKNIVMGAVVGMGVAGFSATAFAMCATPHEKSALEARVLQSELMVAALTCGERNRYNAFVRKFEQPLVTYGKDLKSFYARSYDGHGDAELSHLVTRLANNASKRSLSAATSEYCADAVARFDVMLSAPGAILGDTIKANPNAMDHGVVVCDELAEQ